jgi:hypothetical protein
VSDAMKWRLLIVVSTTCLLAACEWKPWQPELSGKRMTVALTRSDCFGQCPMYRIVLYDDGTLTYEGRTYVKVIGSATAVLDRERVVLVQRAIAESGLSSLGPDCCNCLNVTDVPTVTIEFVSGGARKTIEHYTGCHAAPSWLRDFEDRLDVLLGSTQFVGAPSERRAAWW